MTSLAQRAAPLALLAVACSPTDLEAVHGPGGVFQPGAGCVAADLAAGGPQTCASPPSMGFEQLGDDAAFAITTGNLSNRAVSCRRSFCGTGSLVLHADYRWPPGVTVDMVAEADRMGTLRYRFAAPVDLYNKSLSYALFVDGPDTPVNSLVAIVHGGRFRLVNDGAVIGFRKWGTRSGVLRADNALLQLPPGTTTLEVTEILISVYLATDVRSGDHERWSGDFYIDDVRWE